MAIDGGGVGASCGARLGILHGSSIGAVGRIGQVNQE
jgi:hypothetical protein